MDKLQLMQNATAWIKMWNIEFDVKKVDDVFDGRYQQYFEEGAEIVRNIIDYCTYRDYKPILITVPMTDYLAEKFSYEFRVKMISDFVSRIDRPETPFLNYMFDKRFTHAELYNGSFFLNLKGRKMFTHQVLTDLGLVC